MDKYTAAEYAYENGYKQALRDFEEKLKKEVDIQAKYYGRMYKFSIFNAIEKIANKLKTGDNE